MRAFLGPKYREIHDQSLDITCMWVTHDYFSYSSVTQMINTLGWRSLEQRCADAWLIMFYKIVHGLVEIPLPSYIHRKVRMTRTTHPYHFIQIQTTADYYKYSFFPLAIVQWNNLPTSAVLLEDLTTIYLLILSRSISDHHLRCGVGG